MSRKPKSKVMSDLLAGAYLAQGTIGNVGTPGAPIAKFSLVVVPSQHTVTGTVVITQAIPGPDGYIVAPVTGKIYSTGLGKVTQVVSLQGEYVHAVPPPAIGSFLAASADPDCPAFSITRKPVPRHGASIRCRAALVRRRPCSIAPSSPSLRPQFKISFLIIIVL